MIRPVAPSVQAPKFIQRIDIAKLRGYLAMEVFGHD